MGDNTEDAFRVCGYKDISEDFGVELIDLKKDKAQELDVEGMKINVCGKALGVDYLINMPVLKAHCQTKMTCALKNLKGCIPDKEKRRFHTMGLHRPIAALNKVIKTNLVVVDGIVGDLTYEGGGNPVQMNRVIAGTDPVMVDTYAAELIGYQVDDIPYIGMAEELGVGSAQLVREDIDELNCLGDAPAVGEILASQEADRLAYWVLEQKACSACYSSLIHALQRLKDKGNLEQLTEKVYVGQGFKGKEKSGIGVGTCTGKLTKNVTGCPPTAKNIVSFLEAYLMAGNQS